jgi:hypothetical protein
MQKCEWCKKQSDELKEIAILSTSLFGGKRHEIAYFVCKGHESILCRFYDRVQRYALLFLVLILISLLGLIVSFCLNNYWSEYLSVASLVSMGLVMVVFPFSTPETVAMLGVAKSIKIVRVIGGIIALASIGFIWLN